MTNLNKTKKHGIRSFWVLSYLIIFLMPLVLSVVAGVFIFNGFKKQVEERNSIVLNSVCNTVDAHLEDIVYSSLQLYNNEYVKLIDGFSLPLSPKQQYTVYEFTQNFKTLRGYETIENYSDTFFVYFSGIDFVIKSGAALPSDSFYTSHVDERMLSASEWKDFLKTEFGGAFFCDRIFSEDNELLFARTLKVGYSEDTYVTAVYKINTDKILEEVQGLYHYEFGSFSLSDSNGNIIVNSNLENNPESDKNTSFTAISEVTGWKYTYTLPKSKAFGSGYKIFIIMLLLYLLCFVAGLYLIKYFTRRNYQPIDNLMTLFSNEEGGQKEDEFSFLNEKITESLSHNMELNQELDSQNKMIREHLLSELLQGHTPVGKRSKTELEKLQFGEDDLYSVLMYSFGNENIEELSMKQFVLCNVTDELFTNEGMRFASTKKDEDIVYIVCAKEDTCDKIEEIVRFLYSFTEKEFEFTFYSALGEPHKEIKGIHKSFNKAKRAVEYMIASEKAEFTRYNSVAESLKDGYFYSVEVEARLVNLLKANEQKKADNIIDEIFAKNISEDVSVDSVRHLVVELFSTVKRLMMQYGRSVEKEYPEETYFIENIFESRDTEKMQQTIRSIYAACCKDVFEAPSHKDDLISGVMRYVNQNYSNQNLSLRHIGDAFSMNPDYISRKFREHTGKTMNDYIRDIRIEKAKQLLVESDELIADIAEMVGFTSYRTFVRVFTEVVGVTPNKYKNMK